MSKIETLASKGGKLKKKCFYSDDTTMYVFELLFLSITFVVVRAF